MPSIKVTEEDTSISMMDTSSAKEKISTNSMTASGATLGPESFRYAYHYELLPNVRSLTYYIYKTSDETNSDSINKDDESNWVPHKLAIDPTIITLTLTNANKKTFTALKFPLPAKILASSSDPKTTSQISQQASGNGGLVLKFSLDPPLKPGFISQMGIMSQETSKLMERLMFGQEKSRRVLEAKDLRGKLVDMTCVGCGTSLLKCGSEKEEDPKVNAPVDNDEEGASLTKTMETLSLSPNASSSSSCRFNRIVDLPSEHWAELLDCWMCHQENFAKDRPQRCMNLEAESGTLYIGDLSVVLSNLDVDSNTMRVIGAEKNSETETNDIRFLKEQPIQCSNCMLPLGTSTPAKPNIQLQKHRIKFHLTDTKEPTVTIPFMPNLVHKRFENLIRAHANYRFVIYERNSDSFEPCLRGVCWVLGGMSCIGGLGTARNESDSSSPMENRHTTKLLYLPNDQSDGFQKIVTEWMGATPQTKRGLLETGAFETFWWDDDEIEAFFEWLDNVNCALPVEKRTMRDWKVGWL